VSGEREVWHGQVIVHSPIAAAEFFCPHSPAILHRFPRALAADRVSPREAQIGLHGRAKSDPPKKAWCIPRRGVVDLKRRAEVSLAANTRYLTALSATAGKVPLFYIETARNASLASPESLIKLPGNAGVGFISKFRR
jgi:hypothetical protein